MKIISFPAPRTTAPVEPVLAPAPPVAAAPVLIDLAPLKESLKTVEAEIHRWKTEHRAANDQALTEMKQLLNQVTDRLSALEQRPTPAPGLSADDLEKRLATLRQEFQSRELDVSTPSLWKRLWLYLREPAFKSKES